MNGSLFSYTLLCIRKPSFLVVCFLICSVCGRFGVALLGFAYNMDEIIHHRDPLYRPDWANLTSAMGINATGVGDNNGSILSSGAKTRCW